MVPPPEPQSPGDHRLTRLTRELSRAGLTIYETDEVPAEHGAIVPVPGIVLLAEDLTFERKVVALGLVLGKVTGRHRPEVGN